MNYNIKLIQQNSKAYSRYLEEVIKDVPEIIKNQKKLEDSLSKLSKQAKNMVNNKNLTNDTIEITKQVQKHLRR